MIMEFGDMLGEEELFRLLSCGRRELCTGHAGRLSSLDTLRRMKEALDLPTSIEFHTKGLSAAQTPSETFTRSFPPGFDHVDSLPPLAPAGLPRAAAPAAADAFFFSPAENPHIILVRRSSSALPPSERPGRALGRKDSACHGETSSRSSTLTCCMIRPGLGAKMQKPSLNICRPGNRPARSRREKQIGTPTWIAAAEAERDLREDSSGGHSKYTCNTNKGR